MVYSLRLRRSILLLPIISLDYLLASCSTLGVTSVGPQPPPPTPTTSHPTAYSPTANTSPLPRLDSEDLVPSPIPPRFHVASAEEAQLAFDSSSTRSLNQVMDPDRTLSMADSEPLLWGSGWCATTQEILEQNNTAMGTRLFVNDFQIDPTYYSTRVYSSDDVDNPAVCRSYYILIDSWPRGMTCLEARYAILEPLFDGWEEYDPGLIRIPYCVFVGLE